QEKTGAAGIGSRQLAGKRPVRTTQCHTPVDRIAGVCPLLTGLVFVAHGKNDPRRSYHDRRILSAAIACSLGPGRARERVRARGRGRARGRPAGRLLPRDLPPSLQQGWWLLLPPLLLPARPVHARALRDAPPLHSTVQPRPPWRADRCFAPA